MSKQAVSVKEIVDSYKVNVVGCKQTAWVKDIALSDGRGKRFEGSLRWDEDMGYSLYWETPIPKSLKEMCDRPEFKYALDSLTDDIMMGRDVQY